MQVMKKIASIHPSPRHLMHMFDDFDLEDPSGIHKIFGAQESPGKYTQESPCHSSLMDLNRIEGYFPVIQWHVCVYTYLFISTDLW